MVLRLVILFSFLFGVSESFSSETGQKPETLSITLIEQARSLKLWEKKQWLSLLHYNQGGTLRQRKQSYVKSQQFFLSDKGKHNPRQELETTVRVLFETDIHKRCEFPARFRWLSEQLALEHYQKGLSHCDKLKKLQDTVQAKHLVLVFPSAYMGSASSIFGHTLFRVDATSNDAAPILNWAINFGAQFDPNDGPVAYGFKGIFGLYDGQYFMVPYSQKIKEYGEMENRDIWEYPLELSEKEVSFIIEHLWELQNIDFHYYFFDENCSYRLLELVELARPELELSENLRLTEIPAETVKTLHGHKLISDSNFRASKEKLLKGQLKQLNKTERYWTKKLANSEHNLSTIINNKDFRSLSLERQEKILKTAYAFIRFKQSEKKRDNNMAKRSLELLRLINEKALQIDNKENSALAEKVINEEARNINGENILQSHDSQRLSLSYGKIENQTSYSRFQYRMAYHDFIDNGFGYIEGTEIEGPLIAFENNRRETNVESWQLVNLKTLNPISNLHQKISWSVKIGGARRDEGNRSLSTYIAAGAGFTFSYKKLFHYQLLVPRIENNPDYNTNSKVGLEYQIGFLHAHNKFATHIQSRIIKIDGENKKIISSLQQHWQLAKNHALRLEGRHFEQSPVSFSPETKELRASYLYYF